MLQKTCYYLGIKKSLKKSKYIGKITKIFKIFWVVKKTRQKKKSNLKQIFHVYVWSNENTSAESSLWALMRLY